MARRGAPSPDEGYGQAWGPEDAALEGPPPVDLRVNQLKATIEQAQAALAREGIDTEPMRYAPYGLRLKRRLSVVSGEAFQNGLVEIQDEGSQLVAALVDAKPGMQVADYCAGAGGKTLAMAAGMNNKGRVVAMDVYESRLDRPAERIAHLDIEVASHNWMGPGAHCVHYWVSARRLMNVVCVVEHGTWTNESWTDKGNVADVLARYEGWHPTVRGLIEAFPETFIWALHDRAPLPAWTRGRVALLGDACHPMLPMMAQGAAQAIEDGAALASLLEAMPDDVPSVLRRYEEIRKPRATRLQEASAANRTRFHLADGPEQRKRDEAMANSGDRSMANIGWLYRHDAAQVS